MATYRAGGAPDPGTDVNTIVRAFCTCSRLLAVERHAVDLMLAGTRRAAAE